LGVATRRDRTPHRTVAALLLVAVPVAGLAWTGAVCARAKTARAGVLASFDAGSKEPVPARWREPFRGTLAEYGRIEGNTVPIEFRGAFADPSRLVEAASEMVRRNCDVIWAAGAPFTRAAHAASTTAPIVAIDFTTDPMAEGYAENFGRPGRNITGIVLDAPECSGTWLAVLQRSVPGLPRIAVMWNPGPGRVHLHGVQTVARALDLQEADVGAEVRSRVRGTPL
jgi:putative ABC transport system substrate-binding protein